MKKITVTVEKQIDIEFDENSADFTKLFEGYKSYIDNNASYESFAESIASTICRYGLREFIEGVGFVKHNGKNQTIFYNGEYAEQPAIVNVVVDTDLNSMVDFEITYTREEE